MGGKKKISTNSNLDQNPAEELKVEESKIRPRWSAGENRKYGQLAGISFCATSNPDAKIPAKFRKGEVKNVHKYFMASETLKEPFKEPGPKAQTMAKAKAMAKAKPPSPPVKIIKGSFSESHPGIPTKYGLTGSVLTAYSNHYKLVLKPDNFWQAVLTQFGYYVEANAEQLRHRIVDFQGQRKLHVILPEGTLYDYDYESATGIMLNLVR